MGHSIGVSFTFRRAVVTVCAIVVSSGALAAAADWLAIRGDLQRSGWQRDEKVLTVRSVLNLHLLWKEELSHEAGGLTDPLLLGPIVTHRGIKELVFVRNSKAVYAVDADLGTIFWTRALPEGNVCSGDLPVRPAMAASVAKASYRPAGEDDDFSDGRKPLYVLAGNGTLYALRSSTGEDVSPAIQFLPPRAVPFSLEADGNSLSATTATVCGGAPDYVWSAPVNAPDFTIGSDPQSQPLGESHGTGNTLAFDWRGSTVLAQLTGNGSLQLMVSSDQKPLLLSNTRTTREIGSLATWDDAAGARWIYVSANGCLSAMRVSGSRDQPTTVAAWVLRDLNAPGPPTVASGVVYFLAASASSGTSHLVLHAVDARDGKELYTSGKMVSFLSSSGNLAIANGHVCFSASDGILYCFGLPFEL